MSQDQAEAISESSDKEEVSQPTNEFLTFRLGGEEYGIDILKVQEIRGYDAITQIANAPEFIKGVVNLRGIIVPIVDMRIKFQLGDAEYNEFTVVIIWVVFQRCSFYHSGKYNFVRINRHLSFFIIKNK